MGASLGRYAQRLEELARSHGLDYYPVHFEEVPSSFMMEVAVYGLPVRMPRVTRQTLRGRSIGSVGQSAALGSATWSPS